MIKLKTKNIKPIEIDAHFKYRCPKCGWDHWISLKECQTKNFKIVCDCDTVFKPKRIKNISIQYFSKKSKILVKENKEQTKNKNTLTEPLIDVNPIALQKPLDINILEKCSKLLISYGFTSNEAKKLINEAYSRVNSDNIGLLIKNALEFIGDK